MSNVIDFAAAVNARRASTIIVARETAAAVRAEQERRDIAKKLGGTIGAEIIASVVMDLKAKDREGAAPKFMPAYCDPSNEVRGSKYEATKGITRKETAARIRQDIKALNLDKAIKISVRTSSYSGGGAIDVEITSLPQDFRVMSEKGASWRKQFGDTKDGPFHWSDAQSDEIKALIDTLKRIHSSYNRDNSDSMVDYFDRRFYGDVSLDWQVRREHEAREIAASPGNYWAADCA